jgi:hypothetical protein
MTLPLSQFHLLLCDLGCRRTLDVAGDGPSDGAWGGHSGVRFGTVAGVVGANALGVCPVQVVVVVGARLVHYYNDWL